MNAFEEYPNGCWVWTGARGGHGYGNLKFDGIYYRSNRLAYEMFKGKIPNGFQVCHNCPDGDNPLCVNPNHLWIGTRQENCTDMANKGHGARSARGLPFGVMIYPGTRLKKFRARVSHAGIVYFSEGFFSSAEEAGEKAAELREKVRGSVRLRIEL